MKIIVGKLIEEKLLKVFDCVTSCFVINSYYNGSNGIIKFKMVLF